MKEVNLNSVLVYRDTGTYTKDPAAEERWHNDHCLNVPVNLINVNKQAKNIVVDKCEVLVSIHKER